MNLFKLSVLLIYCSMGIIRPIYATETEKSDSYWCESSTQAMGKIQAQFPADSLDGTVAEIDDYNQSLLDLIDVPGLPGGPGSTGAPLGDIAIIIAAIDPSLTLGTAVGQAAFKISNDPALYIPAAIAKEIGLIDIAGVPNSPGTTNTIDGDLVAAISYINPTANITLGAAIATELGVIDLPGLPGGPVSNDEIDADLKEAISYINPTANITLGAAIATELGVIDLPSLPGGPVSNDEIDADLKEAITYINPTANISLGAAIAAALTKIGVAGLTSFPGPLITADEIDTDLGTLITATTPGSLSVGAAVNVIYDDLGGIVTDGSLKIRTTAILTRLAFMFFNGFNLTYDPPWGPAHNVLVAPFTVLPGATIKDYLDALDLPP